MGEKMATKRNPTELSGIRQKTHEGVDKIMDKAESMRESGKEEIARLKEKATMMKGNVAGYIRKNPEKSVLIAAGIGAVVGAMLTAAMMRKR
jgi:ElaB/YqjD/DUF883 family membrane-anchored ribosome-binding protein